MSQEPEPADDQRASGLRFGAEIEQGNFPRKPLRWRGAVIALAVLAVLAGAYAWRTHTRSEAVRDEIRALYQREVAPVASGVRSLAERVVRWTRGAAAMHPSRLVVDGFEWDELHERRGVLLRVPRVAVPDSGRLQSEASRMNPGALAQCLGIAPTPLTEVFLQEGVLREAWLEERLSDSGVLRLRVRLDELQRVVASASPTWRAAVAADYFLLALDHGEQGVQPIDIFLWDLREDRLLFQDRVVPDGELVAARNLFAEASAPSGTPIPDAEIIAADCSVARQLKGLQARN